MSNLQSIEGGPAGAAHGAARMYAGVYRAVGYFGLASIFGALAYGFRYDAAASARAVGYNALLYAAFIVPHLVMTRTWWKRRVWGDPAGSPRERRVFITITVITWLAIVGLHWPIGGFEWAAPPVVRFVGLTLFLLALLTFFQGVTWPMIDGMLGVPGSVAAYTHGPQTPLFVDGPYAQVRHPQYRAFLLAASASLLIHPQAGQLLWVLMLGATFVAFIPVEEAQMLAARGDAYRQYMQRTRWRLFRGVW
jgi:protein-S-isoprenylcysteine O-methyltransferase Ste14